MAASGASRGAYSAGSSLTCVRTDRAPLAAAPARLRDPEPDAAPFGDRMQRRILQELRRTEFDLGVRGFAKPGAKLFERARTCRFRLTADQHELSFPARTRSQRRARTTRSSSRPTKGVRTRAPVLRRPPAGGHERKGQRHSDRALAFALADGERLDGLGGIDQEFVEPR